MRFTFDRSKDLKNLRKHGISLARAAGFDFEAAQFDIDDSQDYGEVRWNAVGFLDGLLCSITFVQRGSDEIRVISLRKATRAERDRYGDS